MKNILKKNHDVFEYTMIFYNISGQWRKFNLRPRTLTIGPNSLEHLEIWFLAGIPMYVRVRVCSIINFWNPDNS